MDHDHGVADSVAEVNSNAMYLSLFTFLIFCILHFLFHRFCLVSRLDDAACNKEGNSIAYHTEQTPLHILLHAGSFYGPHALGTKVQSGHCLHNLSHASMRLSLSVGKSAISRSFLPEIRGPYMHRNA